MVIKSITDAITNSSSESYIIKGPKNFESIRSLEDILERANPDKFFAFNRDLMILTLEKVLGEKLVDNPFTSWEETEESEVLWSDFVMANKESFEKLLELTLIHESDEENGKISGGNLFYGILEIVMNGISRDVQG